MLGINYLLCLPKAELKTKNSLNQTAALLSFGWVFGFQLDSQEKYLITLTVVAFSSRQVNVILVIWENVVTDSYHSDFSTKGEFLKDHYVVGLICGSDF